MRYLILALLLVLVQPAPADPIVGRLRIADASVHADGTDVSQRYNRITLSTAQGAMRLDVNDPAIIREPLRLISNSRAPVYVISGNFSSPNTDIWSAGECCRMANVLRADFAHRTTEIAVVFAADDHDTGVLQIYAADGQLLGEAAARRARPFTLTLQSPDDRPIAYALATFGDTGQIVAIAYRQPRVGD